MVCDSNHLYLRPGEVRDNCRHADKAEKPLRIFSIITGKSSLLPPGFSWPLVWENPLGSILGLRLPVRYGFSY